MKLPRFKQTALSICLSAAVLSLTACGDPEPSASSEISQLLYNFEENALTGNASERNIKTSLVSGDGVTEGSRAIKLHFDSRHEYSAPDLEPLKPSNFLALGNMNIAFDGRNTGEESVQLYVKITDINGQVQNRSISIPARSGNTYYIDLSGEQISTDSGLRADPAAWSSNKYRIPYMTGQKLLDLSDIKQLSFFISII